MAFIKSSAIFRFFLAARWLQVALRWPKQKPKMAKMRAKNISTRTMIAKMRLPTVSPRSFPYIEYMQYINL